MSDSSVSVKLAFLQSIYDIVLVLGYVLATDVILSHIITFLNDKSCWEIRSGFFDAIAQVGPWVGPDGFCHYILPLILQSLYDSDELVTWNGLKSIHLLIESNLLKPGKTNEVFDVAIGFINHPNEMLRESRRIINQTDIFLFISCLFCYS